MALENEVTKWLRRAASDVDDARSLWRSGQDPRVVLRNLEEVRAAIAEAESRLTTLDASED